MDYAEYLISLIDEIERDWPVELSNALQDALILPLEREGLVKRDENGDYTPDSEGMVNAAIWASDDTIKQLMRNDLRALRRLFAVFN